jgi:catechol 2,3-dioxygenase-like lactoylglutathione lyase family enzyme
MAIQRMDNVLIVVDDLDAVVSFFVELGMELEGQGPVEGRWVERVIDTDIDDVVARLRAHGADLVGARGAVRGRLPALLRPRPRGHHRRVGRGSPVTAAGQTSEAVSMTKRYRTSDFSTRSYASLM